MCERARETRECVCRTLLLAAHAFICIHVFAVLRIRPASSVCAQRERGQASAKQWIWAGRRARVRVAKRDDDGAAREFSPACRYPNFWKQSAEAPHRLTVTAIRYYLFSPRCGCYSGEFRHTRGGAGRTRERQRATRSEASSESPRAVASRDLCLWRSRDVAPLTPARHARAAVEAPALALSRRFEPVALRAPAQ